MNDMIKLWCVMVLSLPQCISAQVDTAADGIHWEDDLTWELVKQKAKQEDKYIFVDCYATWCAPCKMMDLQVYNDRAVGHYMNKNFISVKVQMDTSRLDNEKVKKWYRDANHIKSTYGIPGYPTLLFFNPAAMLMSKELGYKDPNEFYQSAEAARDPAREALYVELSDYKQGKKNYSRMPVLVMQARELLNDEELAAVMAADYKKNYLDKLKEEQLCSKEVLEFIVDNIHLVEKSNDVFFTLFFNRSCTVDSMLHRSGYSRRVVSDIINKEEIEDRIWKEGHLVMKDPDWKRIKSGIAEKYGKEYSESIVAEAALLFYKRTKNWAKYIDLLERKMEQFPPKAGGKMYDASFGDAWGLNGEAWYLFQHANDSIALKKALRWIDLAITIIEEESPGRPSAQVFDTKANLLYKLGKTEEALMWEEKAIGISNKDNHGEMNPLTDEFMSTFNKMKKGLPTW